VLYAGRLSEEKGVLDFVEATEGLPRVIVGDGPLRFRIPEAIGFVPPSEIGAYYERASVVCVPSHREGYGFSAREAMAYGRPVVATSVGGLADLEGDAVALVAAGDRDALRAAVERFLADHRGASAAARLASAKTYSPAAAADRLVAAYEASLRAT
jgi:glycosyltransferase involved in cell wall biosynthesis